MKTRFCLIGSVLFLSACMDNAEKVSMPGWGKEGLYADVQVWGEENSDEVIVRLQFLEGGEEGMGVLLRKPGEVLLDGERIPADSTRFSGVYYELSKPVAPFRGEHLLVIKDEQAREHRQSFRFESFVLEEELPEKIKKEPFTIRLQHLPAASALIRLVMTDTSLLSADVNEELLVENGKVAVTGEYLANLTKGPVTVEIYSEEERPFHTDSKNAGKITITYGLRRHILLTE